MTKEATEVTGLKVFMTMDTANQSRVGFSDIRGRKLEISRDDWAELDYAQGITFTVWEAV